MIHPRMLLAVSLPLLLCSCRALVPVSAPGEASDVALLGSASTAYLSLGEAGLAVVDAATGDERARFPLPPGLGSVDDLALADGLLFALDAREPGALAVLSLADPWAPRPLGQVVPAPVGPFSGVSAAGGRVLVSGGTSPLTVRAYDAQGGLSPARELTVAYGHPDVLLAPDGRRAYVSSHFSALPPDYGVTVLDLARGQASGRLSLPGAGFTPGATRPSSFPLRCALLDPSTLLVAHGPGLAVVDVSDPTAPALLALLELPVRGVALAVRGRLAVVVGSDPTPLLAWVDLAAPRAPRLVGEVALPAGSRPTGVVLMSSAALVAGHEARPLLVRAELPPAR